MIIIINGCPSAGKSSIAKELQKLHNKPLLHTGIDHFWKMVPDEYKEFGAHAAEGYSFIRHVDDQGNPIVYVETGSFGQRMDDTMPHVVNCLAECGHDIVVDEILCRDEIVRNYAQALQKATVYFVGIVCDLQELERREKMRGDRELGLARGQIDTIHRYEKYYDLIVDSAEYDATACAQKIIDYIQTNPDPQGMMRLLSK